MNQIKKKKKSLKGMTLVEIMVASCIFAIAFGVLLTSQRMASHQTKNALIQFTVVHYAQGLLETIQSYEYEPPATYYPHTDDPLSDASQAVATSHGQTIGSFDSSESGVYTDDYSCKVENLTEEEIGLKYYPTTLPSSPSSTNPFERDTVLRENTRLLGPEFNDVNGDATQGIYKITESQREMNIFSSNAKGQERYYKMDDVDDFDGYREERILFEDVTATFEVSVAGVFKNAQDLTYEVHNAPAPSSDYAVVSTITISQDPFTVMQPITRNVFLEGKVYSGSSKDYTDYATELNASDDTTQPDQLAYAYYNSILFKKVSVKATWEFPKGSGRTHTIVLNGGVINDEETIL